MQRCAVELSGGDVAPAPALSASAKKRESWTSQQTEQILRSDHMGTCGALDLLERWKHLSLQCGRGLLRRWVVTGRMKLIKVGKMQPREVTHGMRV